MLRATPTTDEMIELGFLRAASVGKDVELPLPCALVSLALPRSAERSGAGATCVRAGGSCWTMTGCCCGCCCAAAALAAAAMHALGDLGSAAMGVAPA